MDVGEILEWTLEKINFINENSDAITGIEIYNEIETYFGKTYHRIYFKIETEFKYDYFKNPEEPMDYQSRLNALKFPPLNDYVSFYLGGYNSQEDYVSCDCVEVRTNYLWIISVFNILIDRHKYKCDIKRFYNKGYSNRPNKSK
jgi:hypothetical protein